MKFRIKPTEPYRSPSCKPSARYNQDYAILLRKRSGPRGTRIPDLLHAKQAIYH